MSSKLELQQRSYNRGKKDFEFTLYEPSEGLLIIHYAPDGWMDAETSYFRHQTYNSVLRNMSTNELTFYKDARQFILNVYENSGIEANITFTVKKLNKNSGNYESYPSANKIDLSTYKADEISVSVQLIDTQFKEKVINRETTEVDILKNVSIEGLTFNSFVNTELNMPDTNLVMESNWVVNPATLSFSPHAVPIQVSTLNDFSEAKDTSLITSPPSKAAAFFSESALNRNIDVSGSTSGTVFGTGFATFKILRYSVASILQETKTVHTTPSGTNLAFTFSHNENIDLNEGDFLIFQCEYTGTSVQYFIANETVKEDVPGTQEVDIKAYPDYEAFFKIMSNYY